MNLKSLKVNYFYNIVLTLSNLLFPMLIFPFIARIIGPEGLGRVSFATNLALVFITFAQIGIPVYGIREISKNRDNEENRLRIFRAISFKCYYSFACFICLWGTFSNKLENAK